MADTRKTILRKLGANGLTPTDFSTLDGVASTTLPTKGASLTNPGLRLVGDSIMSQNDTVTPGSTGSVTTAITRYPRAFHWFNWLNGGGIPFITSIGVDDHRRKGSNSGIGGNSWSDINNRIDAILATCPEQYILFHAGTNDINGNVSFNTITSNITTVLTKTIAAGKTPIMTTVLPRNGVDGASDWSDSSGSGGLTAAQKRSVLNAVNTWMEWYCRENGIICVTWHHVFADSTGVAKTGYTVEGVHPNETGGYYLGKELLRQIGDLFPKQSRGLLLGNDDFDATYNPYGNILNGDFSGTGGATNNAGGTGTITGTVPDDWRMSKNTSTTTSVATSVIDRTDGTPGKMVEFTFTSAGTGSASEDWRFEYWKSSSLNITSWANAGDVIAYTVDAEVVAGHGGVLKNIGPRFSGTNVVKSGTTISMNAATSSITDSAGGFGSFVVGRRIIITGFTNSANNGAYKILEANAFTLVLLPESTTPLVTEAAGASVTVTLPVISVVAGASASKYPDENTGIFTMTTPPIVMPYTGNVNFRVRFTINGTINDTAVVRISRPKLFKLPITPSLLTYDAHDT